MVLKKKKEEKKKEDSKKNFPPREERSNKDFPPRKIVQGKWNCAECGKEITELPFEPAPDRPIYCRDCWAKQRAQRFNR